MKFSLCLLSLIGIFGLSCNNASKKTAKIQDIKVLTNQVGYDSASWKQAVVSAHEKHDISTFKLINVVNDKVVFTGKPIYKGPVDHWKDWHFWTLNFSDFKGAGKYYLQVNVDGKAVRSYPFEICKNVLEHYTLSDVIYYFKGQRCSGLFDKADSHLPIPGGKGSADVHGGWYDATGDYGIHLSQLDYASYFNTQQVPLVAWSLLKTYQKLDNRNNLNFQQYERRLLDEGMFGADFLVRIHVPHNSFYESISAPGAKKLAKDRRISPKRIHGKFSLTKSPNHRVNESIQDEKKQPQMVSFRSGGGMAIAALALASTFNNSGYYTNTDYLHAAEDAFDFLQKNNTNLTNDGKENIIDDYCALLAATELYKATKEERYMDAATQRADNLMNRLTSWKSYKNYWRANDNDRPFFNASDAGLPVVSLMQYYIIANKDVKEKVLQTVKKSMNNEMAITDSVTNPFGYARQLVQDTSGMRYASFFYPHNTETAPWWQGENARIASLAAAARLVAPYFKQRDSNFYNLLEAYAWNQLNWILGLNPYDACMLDGKGHNNPNYDFFGSYQYTVAPGGIVNGITAGLDNQRDIDFNVPYSVTGKDNDWRWLEQWLPHAAWYIYAISLH